MRAYDIIMKKRNGGINTNEEIEFMVDGYTNGSVPDYQMAAWLMSIYFNHMNPQERHDLTVAMLNSGDKIDLSSLEGKKVDKHSTGGVGDKTTISLAPMVASLGLKVSKLSGRGLGHTGGTVDKLEAIPGFKTSISEEEFFRIANKTGVCVAGQTTNIAPADKKIYALRDTIACVEDISLISASIMSKKLAVLSDGIVLDVKTGSGAFMKSVEDSVVLAKAMHEIAKLNKRNVVALVTNMNQPLGNTVGNSLEVLEAIESLKGNGPEDFMQLNYELAGYMLEISGIMSYEEAKKQLAENIKSGKVAQIARDWIKEQGGDPNVIDNPRSVLKIADKIVHFTAEKAGYIYEIDTEKVGLASMVLGAGRATKDDEIDLGVGLDIKKKLGIYVEKGDIIADLYVSEKSDVEASLKLLNEAYVIKEEKPDPFNAKLIYEVIK